VIHELVHVTSASLHVSSANRSHRLRSSSTSGQRSCTSPQRRCTSGQSSCTSARRLYMASPRLCMSLQRPGIVSVSSDQVRFAFVRIASGSLHVASEFGPGQLIMRALRMSKTTFRFDLQAFRRASFPFQPGFELRRPPVPGKRRRLHGSRLLILTKHSQAALVRLGAGVSVARDAEIPGGRKCIPDNGRCWPPSISLLSPPSIL
jgi:hypothetical protein